MTNPPNIPVLQGPPAVQVGPVVMPLDALPAVAPVILRPTAVLPIARTANSTIPASVRTSPTVLNKRSQITTVTIAAGATLAMSAYGNKWQLLAAPCPVPIRYDPTAGFSTYAPGLGIMIATEASFDRLEFQNPLPSPLTLTIFFGWDQQTAYVSPVFPVTPIEGFTALSNFGILPISTFLLPIYFRRGYFYGLKSAPTAILPVSNSAVIYTGKSQNVPDAVQPGQWVEYDAPAGMLFNLANFFAVSTNAGDGIFWSLT